MGLGFFFPAFILGNIISFVEMGRRALKTLYVGCGCFDLENMNYSVITEHLVGTYRVEFTQRSFFF